MCRWSFAPAYAVLFAAWASAAEPNPPLAPRSVRGLVTKAPASGIQVDGKLTEWGSAFCTPVHYNHAQIDDRAAQFYYAWDDAALYIGLRALDRHRANVAPLEIIADGDAVELYLDMRRGDALRGRDWSKGAIHLFFTAFEGDRLSPRWVIRKRYRHERRHQARGRRDRRVDSARRRGLRDRIPNPVVQLPRVLAQAGCPDGDRCGTLFGTGSAPRRQDVRLRLSTLGPAARLAGPRRTGQCGGARLSRSGRSRDFSALGRDALGPGGTSERPRHPGYPSRLHPRGWRRRSPYPRTRRHRRPHLQSQGRTLPDRPASSFALEPLPRGRSMRSH